MSKVDEALVEINAQLKDIEPKHEGLRDYALLDLQPETHSTVVAAIGRYDRRVGLLADSRRLLQALVEDGHPDLPIQEVEQAVYDDLLANEETIKAALGQFSAGRATSLGLSAAPPQPKT